MLRTVCAAAFVLSACTPAVEAPTPKPGKWKMTMTLPGESAPHSLTYCLTADMLAKEAASAAGQSCEQSPPRREGKAIVTSMTCDAGGAKTAIVTRTEGDLEKHYTVSRTATSDPPAPTGDVTTTTTADYLGPC